MTRPLHGLHAGLAMILCALVLAACATSPKTVTERALVERANATISDFKARDPGIQRFFDSSYGYAVFPNVGKAGFIGAAAYGRGVVYRDGEHVGYCDLTQGSVGATIGAQSYQEIIFFEHRQEFENFIAGQFTLAAQASAIALTAGASADADYDKGVAVFTMGQGGVMVDASVGGQNFTYESLAVAGDN